MQLTQKDVDGVRVIEVEASRIDAAVAISFKDLMRELSEDAPERIVLDLKVVEFVDSSGLGAVVAAMKQVGTERSLELAGLTAMVAKVFALTRMDSVFKIHTNVDDALNGGYANAS
ncbi:MAG: STAS domain-containing protein [Rhodobacteraceae bacterium]|nr:STAS domain-containing protein [Paracoccaceae bacterium]